VCVCVCVWATFECTPTDAFSALHVRWARPAVHYVCQMIDPSDPTRLTPFESTRDGQQTLPKSFQLHSGKVTRM
jgi:hypothetical protein